MIAMEDISHGERIREYVVEGRASGGDWEQLAVGQSIGHMRIQSFSRREFAAVRLRLTKSIALPKLRRVAVFDTAGYESESTL